MKLHVFHYTRSLQPSDLYRAERDFADVRYINLRIDNVYREVYDKNTNRDTSSRVPKFQSAYYVSVAAHFKTYIYS